MPLEDVKIQSTGAYIYYLKNLRLEGLQALIQDILNEEKKAYSAEDLKLIGIQSYIHDVREFVYDPSHILGSEMTKHGEIVEKLDVLNRNCLRIIEDMKIDATFENVGRTAPEDYIVASQAVQSKFYSGINKTLKAVLEHNKKYEYFGADGKSYYVIPKDQYAAIMDILSGNKNVEINGQPLRLSKIQETKELVKLIEERTNRTFSDVTQSSAFDYSDPKLGNVNQTLDKQEEKFKVKIENKRQKISDMANNGRRMANEQAKPSFMGATKIAGVATLFGGSISLGISVYNKAKSGKRIENFTSSDWKDIGVETIKGASKGGLTGYSIYYLTEICDIPAPLASAYTAATFGVLNAANQYRKGDIDFDDFIELSQLVCIDSSLGAIGAAVGQMIIPVPILGAVLGSVTSSIISSIAKDFLNKKEIDLLEIYQRDYEKRMLLLDEKYKIIYDDIIKEYKNLKDISNFAFNIEINKKLHLQASVDLAVDHGVDKSRLLINYNDIDQYFTC